MATAEAIRALEPVTELACLSAHGQLYGVGVRQIREIVRSHQLTPLPNAPVLIEGVIDLRGVMLPVIDLGRAIGQGPLKQGPRMRIAVLEANDMSFGLLVDTAVDVFAVGPDDLCDAPALATRTGYDAVRGMLRRENGPPILVLSLEHLLERVRLSTLPVGEASEGSES